jgi:hypothetical protein
MFLYPNPGVGHAPRAGKCGTVGVSSNWKTSSSI